MTYWRTDWLECVDELHIEVFEEAADIEEEKRKRKTEEDENVDVKKLKS